MGVFFNYLMIIFQNQLAFDQLFKSFYLILSVVLGACFYLFSILFDQSFSIRRY